MKTTKVLVCNVGSTSLKFKLYLMPEKNLLAEGKIERVGTEEAIYYYGNPDRNLTIYEEQQLVPDYLNGVQRFLNDLTGEETGAIRHVEEIEVVGFKTVLAKNYYGVHELTDEVIEGMKFYMGIAGSHNGPYMQAIEQFQKLLPSARFIGSFETGFHQTIPMERRIYGLPYEWYETYGIQRMGYHGASHGYIAGRIDEMEPEGYRMVSCHLGGSSSLCAVENGKSVDTSFGMSLQTGILHANRAGDTDTSLVPFLLSAGMSLEEINEGLVKRGGLYGISGVSNDLRDLEQAAKEGNERAELAISVFVTNIVRTIGSFWAEMGGLEYLVFTGGIGENSVMIRERVCERLKHLGVCLDRQKNLSGEKERENSAQDSAVKILVIPTNEEIEVARRVCRYLERRK